jgi:hypothetical protein
MESVLALPKVLTATTATKVKPIVIYTVVTAVTVRKLFDAAEVNTGEEFLKILLLAGIGPACSCKQRNRTAGTFLVVCNSHLVYLTFYKYSI